MIAATEAPTTASFERCADFVPALVSLGCRRSPSRSTLPSHSRTQQRRVSPTRSPTTDTLRRPSTATTRTVRLFSPPSAPSAHAADSLPLPPPPARPPTGFALSASRPDCPEAVLIWQHGRYEFHANGSLTLDPTPFAADGRIQVQVSEDCSSEPNILTYYSQWEIFNSWTITVDLNHAAYMLQLTKFDDSKFNR